VKRKRKLVNAFAAKMEEKMAANDYKDKTNPWWKDRGLFMKLEDEVEELWIALEDGSVEAIVQEAADVANFAMMIAGQADPDWRKMKNE